MSHGVMVLSGINSSRGQQVIVKECDSCWVQSWLDHLRLEVGKLVG